MGLTGKQRAFAIEYPKDYNGTQSAIRAGYSKNGAGVTAHHLLKNPKIIEELDRVYAGTVMSANEALAGVSAIARGLTPDCTVSDRLRAYDFIGKYYNLTNTTVVRSWQDDMVDAIRDNGYEYEFVVGLLEELNEDVSLADQFFRKANVPITG